MTVIERTFLACPACLYSGSTVGNAQHVERGGTCARCRKGIYVEFAPATITQSAVKAFEEIDVLINEVLDQWTWPIRTYGDMRGWIGRLSDAVKRGQGHPPLALPRDEAAKETE